MDKFQLILTIESVVKGNYTAWHVGITDKPEEKKKEYGNPGVWHFWQADNEEKAMDIWELFINLGCKKAEGKFFIGPYIFLYQA